MRMNRRRGRRRSRAVGGRRVVHGADCGVAERGGNIAVVGVGIIVVEGHVGPGIRRGRTMTQRWRCHGLRRHDKPVAAGREGREEGEGRENVRNLFFLFFFFGERRTGKDWRRRGETLKALGGERRQSKFNAGAARALIGPSGIFRSCGGLLFRFSIQSCLDQGIFVVHIIVLW